MASNSPVAWRISGPFVVGQTIHILAKWKTIDPLMLRVKDWTETDKTWSDQLRLRLLCLCLALLPCLSSLMSLSWRQLGGGEQVWVMAWWRRCQAAPCRPRTPGPADCIITGNFSTQNIPQQIENIHKKHPSRSQSYKGSRLDLILWLCAVLNMTPREGQMIETRPNTGK